VFATLEDRGAKLEAQRIINSYCTVQPASEAVKRVLVGLKSTDSEPCAFDTRPMSPIAFTLE